MTGLQYTGTELKKVNKKKAGLAMCLSSLLLFFIPLCSFFASLIVSLNMSNLLNGVIKLLMLTGVGKAQAIASAKHLFSSGAFSVFIEMVLMLFSLVLPAFIFSKCVKMDSGSTFPWKGKIVKGFVFIFFAMQIVVLFAGNFSTDIYDFLIPDSKISPVGFVDYSHVEFDVYNLILHVIHVCIFVPFIEEYAFRGVIFGYLKRYGLMYGIFASAVMFGVAHSSPSQSVYAFCFGLFAAFLVAYTGSIKTSIIFHAVNNFISIINEQMQAYVDDGFWYLFNSAYNVITLFLGVWGLYLLAKKDGLCERFRQKCVETDGEGGFTPGIKQIFVFSVIIYIGIYTVSVLLTAV